MNVISEEQSRFYKDQGYLIIEDFLSKSELAHLLSALDRVIEAKAKKLTKDSDGFNLEKKRTVKESPFEGQAVGPGILRKIQGISRHSPEFEAFFESDKMLDLVEDLIGPTIYYHSSKLMFNPPKVGKGKPWHQDYAYWSSTEPAQVTVWVALDDATKENGCMQLIPESHKLGLLKHHRAELQVDDCDLPMEKVKFAEMKAGSLLAFHVLTFHKSEPNLSDKTRRAMIVDYDPNKRPVKYGHGGDKALRIDGVKPVRTESPVVDQRPQVVG